MVSAKLTNPLPDTSEVTFMVTQVPVLIGPETLATSPKAGAVLYVIVVSFQVLFATGRT